MVTQDSARSHAALDALVERSVKAWGGKFLLLHYDVHTGAWIIIAVHAARAQRAGGGTRMMRYPHLQAAIEDALRLSSAMTMKFGAVGFAWGGAKTVIFSPSGLSSEARLGLLRRYGGLLQDLRGLYYTGPDIGTSVSDMLLIAEHGSPYVICRPLEAGGFGDPGPSTALGVVHSMRAVATELFGEDSLAGRRILIQGAGDVGAALIALLHAAGAHLLVSDVDAAKVERMQAAYGVEPISPETVYDTPCDFFAPCAVGGILNSQTIARLRCQAVVGSANNQLSAREDAQRLQARQILYAPDFICNAGGILAAFGVEATGWTREEAERQIATRIPQTLQEIFSRAKNQGMTTEAVAQQLAETRTPVDSMESANVNGPRE